MRHPELKRAGAQMQPPSSKRMRLDSEAKLPTATTPMATAAAVPDPSGQQLTAPRMTLRNAMLLVPRSRESQQTKPSSALRGHQGNEILEWRDTAGNSLKPATPSESSSASTEPAMNVNSAGRSTHPIARPASPEKSADSTVDDQNTRHLFNLPQELIDIIFDYAYPKIEGLILKLRNNFKDEDTVHRMHGTTRVGPGYTGPKVSELLISKRFFETAAKAYVVNNQPIDRHQLWFCTISEDYKHQKRNILLRFTTKAFTTCGWTAATALSGVFPSLRHISITCRPEDFEDTAPQKYVWEDEFEEKDFAKAKVLRKLSRTSGLQEVKVVSDDDGVFDHDPKKAAIWHANLERLEKILCEQLLEPEEPRTLEAGRFDHQATASDSSFHPDTAAGQGQTVTTSNTNSDAPDASSQQSNTQPWGQTVDKKGFFATALYNRLEDERLESLRLSKSEDRPAREATRLSCEEIASGATTCGNTSAVAHKKPMTGPNVPSPDLPQSDGVPTATKALYATLLKDLEDDGNSYIFRPWNSIIDGGVNDEVLKSFFRNPVAFPYWLLNMRTVTDYLMAVPSQTQRNQTNEQPADRKPQLKIIFNKSQETRPDEDATEQSVYHNQGSQVIEESNQTRHREEALSFSSIRQIHSAQPEEQDVKKPTHKLAYNNCATQTVPELRRSSIHTVHTCLPGAASADIAKNSLAPTLQQQIQREIWRVLRWIVFWVVVICIVLQILVVWRTAYL